MFAIRLPVALARVYRKSRCCSFRCLFRFFPPAVRRTNTTDFAHSKHLRVRTVFKLIIIVVLDELRPTRTHPGHPYRKEQESKFMYFQKPFLSVNFGFGVGPRTVFHLSTSILGFGLPVPISVPRILSPRCYIYFTITFLRRLGSVFIFFFLKIRTTHFFFFFVY